MCITSGDPESNKERDVIQRTIAVQQVGRRSEIKAPERTLINFYRIHLASVPHVVTASCSFDSNQLFVFALTDSLKWLKAMSELAFWLRMKGLNSF